LIGVLTTPLAIVLESGLLWSVAAFAWISIADHVLDRHLPPVALLLGQSRADTLVLQAVIQSALSGGRVMSLLDLSKYSGSRWAKPSEDAVLRALDDKDWLSLARELARIAPIIILDGRSKTPHVEVEVSMLHRERLGYKTLVVGPRPSGQETARHSLSALLDAGAREVTIDGLILTLGRRFGILARLGLDTEGRPR
jgi:hypothetical protein